MCWVTDTFEEQTSAVATSDSLKPLVVHFDAQQVKKLLSIEVSQ